MTSDLTDRSTSKRRMPAEWEPHSATWIGWPHHAPDWPGKFEPIPWVYAEIVRALHRHERVEILCHSDAVSEEALRLLRSHAVDLSRVALHHVATDRVWLRDSGPTAVVSPEGRVHWVQWRFNGWAKYPNHTRDQLVPARVLRAEFAEVEVLDDTGRGDGGFGSTGR